MRLLPHPLRRASIASLTALTLLAAPVHAAEPAPTSPEETARFERARDLYTSDQYLPAAELFEDLYATTKTPIYLYYAGLAREGAGHEAHAIQHWQQALKLGLDPEFTEKAQSRLTQAKTRTTALTTVVDPAGLTDGATLVLTNDAGQRKPITLTPADVPVHLEAGNWTASLSVKHPAFEPLTIPLVVNPGTPTMTQTFAVKPHVHAVTLAFTPTDIPLDGSRILVLKDAENLSPEIRLRVQTHEITTSLRPGTWRYTLETPGQGPQSGTIAVSGTTPPVTIALGSGGRSDSDALLAKPTRRKLALGLGLGALAPAIGGGVLMGLSFSGLSDAEKTHAMTSGMSLAPVLYDEYALKKLNNFGGTGSLLVGTAGGLLIGTIMATRPIKHRAWYGVLGGGLATAVVGFAWNGATFKSRNAEFTDAGDGHTVPASDWTKHRGHLMASTALLGIGVGLGLSSVIALIAARPSRSRGARAQLGTTPFRPGIVLHF